MNTRIQRIEPFLRDFGIEWGNFGYEKNFTNEGGIITSEVCTSDELEGLQVLYYHYKKTGLNVSNSIYWGGSTVVQLMARAYSKGEKSTQSNA